MYIMRRVYFMHWNLLCYKEIRVETDNGFNNRSLMELQRLIYSRIDRSLNPAVDTSVRADTKAGRVCNDKYIVSPNGMSVRQFYDEHTGAEHMAIPYYYLYIANFPKEKISFLQNTRSFFDLYYNPLKSGMNLSKALVLLQMLCSQGKADYITDIEKFYVWCDYILRNEARVIFKSDVTKVENKIESESTTNPVCGTLHQDYFGLA